MRVWSKLTLAVAAGAWIFPASPCPAEDKAPAPAPKAERLADVDDAAKSESNPNDGEQDATDAPPKGPSVELRLVIGGLGSSGCDVDVKPGNPACHFKTQTKHVASDGKLTLVFRNVEIRSIDRHCLFTITMREPGQEPKTVHRGFRMSHSALKAGTQSFTCFMSSPSKVANLEREGRVVR